MKVLKRNVMPDGTEIQIEDWSETYNFMAYGSTIAAYPKDRYGDKFRTSVDFSSNEVAERVFKKLIDGTKTLKDFNFTVFNGGQVLSYETKL